MTIFFHELRRNRISLIIWSGILSVLLAVSIFIYPEMSSQMNEINDMFSEMGSFSDAFGMTELNFGEFVGFFGVECGNSFGLGGSFFAAILGASMLSKEEKDKTAEFLLTHPVSRSRVCFEKLLAVIAEIFILNAVVCTVSLLSAVAIGETDDLGTVLLLLLSQLCLQIEIAAVTFGISAFIKRASLGIGLGLTAVLYFMNIMSNLTEDLDFLKYITPFAYTESAEIIKDGHLSYEKLAVGLIISAVAIVLAFLNYRRKDIS